MSSDGPTSPATFHYDLSDDWAVWVLDHGLPTLPDVLGEDDEIPIAYWAAPSVGAVLFRSWAADSEDAWGTERHINDDHYSFVRTAAGWEGLNFVGGSGGPNGEPMRPPVYPDRLAVWGGEWEGGGHQLRVRGLTGIVGAAARTIELFDRHGVTRGDINAPLGQILVCFDAADNVTVRVLDSNGELLTEKRLSPDRYP